MEKISIKKFEEMKLKDYIELPIISESQHYEVGRKYREDGKEKKKVGDMGIYFLVTKIDINDGVGLTLKLCVII